MKFPLVQPRLRAWVAAPLAVLLVAASVAIGGAPAHAEPVAEPVVTVTPSSEIDPAVETTLTIEGTGFVGAGAALGVYVNLGTAAQWAPGTVPSAGDWVASGWVRPAEVVDGGFVTTLVASAGALEPTGSYGIATFAAHGLSATDRTLDSFTPIALVAPVIVPDPEPEPEPEPAPAPQVTVSKTSGLDPRGEVITVTGTGFLADAPGTDGTRPPLLNAFSGVYVAFGKYADVWQPSESAPPSARVNGSATWFVHAADLPRIGGAARGGAELAADGSFTINIPVAPGFKDEPATGQYGIYTYAGGGAVHAPFETATVLSFAAATPPTPPVSEPAPVPTTAGSLTWGVKESFRSYILNPNIANGRIELNGVGTSGGAYVFGQAAGGSYTEAGRTGTSNYSGSVRFWGHHGELDVTFADPTVSVDSASSGTLYVSANGSRVALATLNLAAASVTSSGGAVAYRGVPATLTSAGTAVFAIDGSAIYPAGTALDAVSFVVGATSAGGGSSVFTAAMTDDGPAPTAPATTGITLGAGSDVRPGGTITITAGGFQANEAGILVVLYSTPTVLDRDARADANGVVTWTGALPQGFAGKHTLTLQGSVDRGIELDIPATIRAAAVQGCAIDDATLAWGFKEAFRSYLSSTIANGEWSVADGAEYETPLFGFTGGEGSYDVTTGEGIVGFNGSIRFTGHGGILDTTVANPQVRLIDTTRGVLLLDVTGETQQGEAVSETAVEFADVDLSEATVTDADGSVTIEGATVTLTEAGAAAFGTYEAGEEFDALTISFGVDDCAAAIPVPEATDAGETAGAAPADFSWLAWAIPGGIVVLAVLVMAVLLVRRAPQ